MTQELSSANARGDIVRLGASVALVGACVLATPILVFASGNFDPLLLASMGAGLSAASLAALGVVWLPHLRRGVLRHNDREIATAPRLSSATGLVLREDFLDGVTRDLALASSGVLGLFRVASFDQVVAFDPQGAERLMHAVARRLEGAVTPGRRIAHLDRDCFALWLVADVESAVRELEAIGYVLAQDIDLGEAVVTPDIQIGSAAHPMDALEADALLNRAFVSLARPQRTVEGAISFFARPEPEVARRRFSMEQDLRRAIRRDELSLDYQPFVDLAMGRVVGAEALLRWRVGADAVASPSQVVAVLEEAGLVHEVGLWTFNAACRQLRAWRDAGLDDIRIAVNVSAQQLRDRALASAMERTVAAHGLSPSQLELELTETATMEDVGGTHAVFERLREMGFSLAIDDFGSGYSSLSYLRRLPFQKLKIDREFVSHLDTRADSRTICKALIDLTAGLEMSVLAEGVERFEEVELLRAMGCPSFQGYYFSRPAPPQQFFDLVTDAEWLARVCSRVHREHHELRRRLS